ncbi:hypothetical protein PJK45_10835 [Mycobacterium kansasii]|uniref:Membrane protein n=3 Tax=Mycobacterium kansasii TaxID=1768 RepID=U5WVP4_MYCKA|nr:hypothetical protein [Mycobacterium kansasii]EUA05653.1 putative membrane protein [Mycobacterium kansasii 824]AGZ52001.1 membrane protein [Mycobacterium kansasii ATCC 12478]ARG56295.1 hypothetical protein B1T43_10955 [Mycobacterium kansasii]ARG61745.1 hypothetical protein B1T45_11040 [Mycobacterium kansasii]ARG69427.1 hypothetical protein B1T47_10660 [Mycobacterium kansasii]
MIRTETLLGGIGGVATGYVLWLVAISIGEDLTTVSSWSVAVLMLSGVLAVCAVLGGLLLRWRSNHLWAAFVFGLPILPVVLTLAVLADIYL